MVAFVFALGLASLENPDHDFTQVAGDYRPELLQCEIIDVDIFFIE